MAAPGTFTSGQVLTAAEMNDLPAGVLYSSSLANGTVITAGTTSAAATLFSTTVTPVTGRKVMLLVSVNYSTPTAVNTALRATYDGSVIAYMDRPATTAAGGLTIVGFGTGDGSAQTLTIEMLFASAPGATNVNQIANAILMDIGT